MNFYADWKEPGGANMMEAFYRELNEQMYWGRDDNLIPAFPQPFPPRVYRTS